ncbi:hypothetical protein [Helicobacter sp. L8]|nr:hypothetical protein [Helicobacter sp. L8]
MQVLDNALVIAGARHIAVLIAEAMRAEGKTFCVPKSPAIFV